MNFFILLALLSLLSVVRAQGEGGENGHEHGEAYIDYHTHPHYHFNYQVHDPKHHDFKRQWEKRDGDKVEGEYSIAQPDGKMRIVKYRVDKHSGFVADVKYEGGSHYHRQIQY